MNTATFTQMVSIRFKGRTEMISKAEAEALRDDLTNLLHADGTSIAAEAIIKAVGDEFHVAVDKMKSHRRVSDIVLARHVSWYLLRRLTYLTLKDIAAMFGKKDHGTVVMAVKKIEQMRTHRHLKEHLERLEKQLCKS